MYNVENIRKDFPIFEIKVNQKPNTFLDSGASAQKPKCVIDKQNEYYEQYGVNVNRGVYKLSYQATTEYEESRELCAKFLNSKTNEIVLNDISYNDGKDGTIELELPISSSKYNLFKDSLGNKISLAILL